MEDDWQTQKSCIRERAEVLFSTKDLSDCEFLVGTDKVKIPSHKLFLGMASPVFYAMFYGEMAEKSSIEIKDIEPDAFRGMLQYIYSDKVDFESCTHACTVYSAAMKYLLPYLEEYCIKYLRENITANSACELYEFSLFHDITDIKEMCLQVFQDNTSEVLKSAGFLECEFSTVLKIFEQNKLELDTELQLFQGLQDWTEAEAARLGVSVESLAMSVTEALSKIMFLMMTAEEFTSGPALSPLLTSEEKLAIAMNITKPGVIGIPERINKSTEPRRPLSPMLPPTVPPIEWSLVREVSDTIVYPITRWVNPFPRKGLTVSRNIRLKGVKIASQRVSTSGECSLTYKENVTIVLKKDWAVKFSGAKYMLDTPYNDSFTVLFTKPVLIEVGKKYWIIIQFDKNGDYQFMRDVNSVYNLNNIRVELYEEFSPITEYLFCDKPEE
ncbi:BTB/POZ domain-containing protein 6-like [Macrosteles quadrilineatus]|uniref:BTB/POZ domain-containing protein 6-like n=1 Tax=Macrosteles quadrilineatus TaxID=74068 RepID=UPI0023E15334|nr:BTB/POZ domain-containing protein 6-like [Macrosteles quadrilineatus]